MDVRLDDKIALNVTEAAAALGVSRPVVYQLMHRSDFPSFKVGNRTLIPRQALEEWVNLQVKSRSSECDDQKRR